MYPIYSTTRCDKRTIQTRATVHRPTAHFHNITAGVHTVLPFFVVIWSTGNFNLSHYPGPKSQQQINGNSVSYAMRIVNDFTLSPRARSSEIGCERVVNNPGEIILADIPRYFTRDSTAAQRSKWRYDRDVGASKGRCRVEREGGSRFNSKRLVHIQKFCAECQDVVMLRPRALPVSS